MFIGRGDYATQTQAHLVPLYNDAYNTAAWCSSGVIQRLVFENGALSGMELDHYDDRFRIDSSRQPMCSNC